MEKQGLQLDKAHRVSRGITVVSQKVGFGANSFIYCIGGLIPVLIPGFYKFRFPTPVSRLMVEEV